ncbi:A-kinase anchor protein inhibitor 1 [Suncus etruscus]|uniref:A-kinase anchor protein inhibitor 1 n=1 Tax=Suncus etruscus TaxID=109475 RepID=UPI00210FF2F0|nr:A-kinase anchor protein inhibitor 1 [Suncus etruscus]
MSLLSQKENLAAAGTGLLLPRLWWPPAGRAVRREGSSGHRALCEGGAVRGADPPSSRPAVPGAPAKSDFFKSWPSSPRRPVGPSVPRGAPLLEEIMVFAPGEKPGNEPEEVKLQNASKQIVQNAILQAVQQVSQESGQGREPARDHRGSFQLGVGGLTKKHEKK